MTSNLAPCKCGSSDISLARDCTTVGAYAECNACGAWVAQQPDYDGENLDFDSAIAAWNKEQQ